jgi:hypothetical protein
MGTTESLDGTTRLTLITGERCTFCDTPIYNGATHSKGQCADRLRFLARHCVVDGVRVDPRVLAKRANAFVENCLMQDVLSDTLGEIERTPGC